MNKSYQFCWWLAIINIFIMNLTAVLLTLIFPGINSYLLSMYAEFGIIISILLGIIYTKNHNISTKESLGLKPFNPLLLLIFAIMTIGVQYYISFLTLPLQSIIMIMFGIETSTSQMVIPTDFGNLMILFINICIAAPLLEELLCRGIIIKLTEKYGTITSLITSTLIFTLLHFEMRTAVPIFFTGLLFGAARILTGSVILPMFMHALNNFISFSALTFLKDTEFINLDFIIILSAILFPILIYYVFSKRQNLFDYSTIKSKQEKTGISVAFILCILLFTIVNLNLFLHRLADGSCYATHMILFK